MLKAYRYKLEPNQSQRYALARTLDVCRELYNDCLFQRKLQPISRYEQSKQLTQLKAEFPVYQNVYSQVLQHVLGRVDQAFKNFFRSDFGFPRFKGAKRYDSFTYPRDGILFRRASTQSGQDWQCQSTVEPATATRGRGKDLYH
jgi:putative transposase